MKYSEILKRNQELKKELGEPDFKISMLSNIINHQLKDILEYNLRSGGLNGEVIIGEYDNIVQDSLQHNSSDVVLVFYELANIVDSFIYKVELFSDKEFNDLVEKIKSEITFVFENLKKAPIVLFNKFSTLVFDHLLLDPRGKAQEIASLLNTFINELSEEYKNVTIVDIDKVLASTSVDEATDFRYFSSSKMLYSVQFNRAYSSFIRPYIFSLKGKAKKALVLDCDNTLWKGILGEDGFDAIQMSASTPAGKAYMEVQLILKKLAKNGVLLNLCSKNNPEDVDEVIEKHEDMTLKADDIIIKKVNWQDKVSNIREIAKELNIGLDSLVFVDDSDFEVNFVRESLPEVTVVQVPKKAYEYPILMQEVSKLFVNAQNSKEDAKRTAMYKEEQKRKAAVSKFNNIDDYLSSLELVAEISINNIDHYPRLAQMTQKTNQFNLTTKRYSESELSDFINSDDSEVFSLSVRDKFGDSGITGLAILKINDNIAEVDTLLLSCRILGRRIENIFFSEIVDYLSSKNIELLNSLFIPTHKNAQVSDYFDKQGMELKNENDGEKSYQLNLKDFKSVENDHIKVIRS
ncbi:MAG: hypothetical protein CMP59_09290 [Flavobacteriales bacterium]|nr:hypothetical protein [Flavobacteriales bacterium]|tara:strand:- start:3383 stop:5113 length:1731 start_codon:yes stop_codon:yes gene_type:complete